MLTASTLITKLLQNGVCLLENLPMNYLAEAMFSDEEHLLSPLQLINFYNDKVAPPLAEIFQLKFGYNDHKNQDQTIDRIKLVSQELKQTWTEFQKKDLHSADYDQEGKNALKVMSIMLMVANDLIRHHFLPLASANKTSFENLYDSRFLTHLKTFTGRLGLLSSRANDLYNYLKVSIDLPQKPSLLMGNLMEPILGHNQRDDSVYPVEDHSHIPERLQKLLHAHHISIRELGGTINSSKGFFSNYRAGGSIITTYPFEDTPTWWQGFLHEIGHIIHKHVQTKDTSPDEIIKQELDARSAAIKLSKEYGITIDIEDADNAVMNHARRLGIKLDRALLHR